MPERQFYSPYPNPYELMRALLRALDIKQSNKVLDERVTEVNYDHRELNQLIDSSLLTAIEKYIGPDAKELVTELLGLELGNYLRFVGQVPACGLSRPQMLSILNQGLLVSVMCKLASKIEKQFSGPQPVQLFGNDCSAVSTVMNWLDNNLSGWKNYTQHLSKEDKDRLTAWCRGDDLPSAQSIHLLSQKLADTSITALDWQQVKALLFWARAIEWLKRSENAVVVCNEIRAQLWGASSRFDTQQAIKDIQHHAKSLLGPNLALIGYIQQELRCTTPKGNSKEYKQAINTARQKLSTEQYAANKYWLDWHEARWHVFAGELNQACKLYKQAVEGALFKAGFNQKDLIEEALVIAASLKTPDKVMLKHLKWAMVNFEYDIPSINTEKPSNKLNDNVEPWEIKMWRASFHRVFPAKGWFAGTDYETKGPLGPLIFTDKSKVQPDYRYPDRRIKVGETWQKTTPQLVWFIDAEQYNVCEQLLAKGANVNVTSESGDTPILMALEAMNVTELPYRSLDERFFWLISGFFHHPDIINGRTQKKRLLPIISAVESGRLDVVKKVLDLGADPTIRGETDEQTALNVCLKRIATLKNPDKARACQEAMPINDEVLDSIRRYSAGLTGFSLEEQAWHLTKMQSDEQYQRIHRLVMDLHYKRIIEKMNLNVMRAIAKLLIESGSDVNAEHTSPIKGYTPLMLAAESDEYELFNLMLIHGGDPKKCFIDNRTNERVSCFEIANYWQACNVKKILSDISPHLPTN